MPLLGFTVFKEKILDGSKTQTIRHLRKKKIRKGDKLYLYWHLRQKDCEKLKEVTCKETFFISITYNYRGLGYTIRNWGTDSQFNNPCEVMLEKEEKELYTRDGFANLQDFLDFFKKYLLNYPHWKEGTVYLQVIRW